MTIDNYYGLGLVPKLFLCHFELVFLTYRSESKVISSKEFHE